MQASRAAHPRLPVGFEGGLLRLLQEAIAGGLAQLGSAGAATSDPTLRRDCQDGLEQLWMRRQALVRALSIPARSGTTPDGTLRGVDHGTPVDESTVELDIATADTLRALLDAGESEWRELQFRGGQAEDMPTPVWPPAPARCAAALRWAVERASTAHPVRMELMRLGTRVLAPQFAALCRRQWAGPHEVGPGGGTAASGRSEQRAATPKDLIEAARPGEWFRMVLLAQWADARMTWRSANGRFFMFSSQLAGRAHSISRGSLERLVERGEFRPLGRKPSGSAGSEDAEATKESGALTR